MLKENAYNLQNIERVKVESEIYDMLSREG